MIYRCRWCERGYCEDCLDWEKTDLLGDNLQEFELLGVSAVTQAFFICCPLCVEYYAANPEDRFTYDTYAADIESIYQKRLNEKAAADKNTTGRLPVPPSRAESLTDASTAQDSSVATPQLQASDNNIRTPMSKKRKAAPDSLETTSHKRLTQISS